MVKKHPVCALHLTMPFEAIDVNVHPNKLEVRFSDERALCVGIANIIYSALKTDPMRSPPALQMPDAKEQKIEQSNSREKLTPIINFDMPFETNRPPVKMTDSAILKFIATDRRPVWKPSPPLQPEVSQIPLFPSAEKEEQTPLRVVGSAFLSYIIVEMGETLYLIDQHAAHERILYERMKNALDNQTAFQMLLTPQVVQLTHREHASVLANIEDLSACGFEIEDFGDHSIQVRALPMVLGVTQTKDFLLELVERISEFRTMPTLDQKRNVLIQMACKKAVKAGDSLPAESISALLSQMRETGAPPTCPHGRPLVVRIEKADIDKRFRRI